MLILPGNPLFDLTLSTAVDPTWQEAAEADSNTYAFVADADTGIMRAVTSDELEDYLYGGEYDQRLSEIEDDLE